MYILMKNRVSERSRNVSSLEADLLVQLNAAMVYYNATWLNGDFPPAMWNVHAATTRTNNVVEGWHSRLNKAIGCCHPNVYKLVTVLKGEQALTELTLRRADTGAPPPPRRRKYRDLDIRLDRLLDQYRQGQLTTDNYLTALRHVVHHYLSDNGVHHY